MATRRPCALACPNRCRAVTETETRSKRLIRNLELADPIDQDLIRDINERRAELRARRNELETQLAAAQDQASQEPSPALLNQLPVTPVDLASMPDEISRQLFEALRLEIRYDFTTHIAACQITLAAETIDAVARTSRQTMPSPPHTPSQPETGMICVAPPAGFEPARVCQIFGVTDLVGSTSVRQTGGRRR
ncbi:MAG: hypothetical protein ACLPS1_09575 [Streptosporangiaceae bacterium]|jgi:hypothetical protein